MEPLSSSQKPIPITSEMLDISGSKKQTTTQFESNMSAFPLMTILLIIVIIGVFIVQLLVGGLESEEAIVQMGALVRWRVLAGEWFRVISMIFLHGSVDHILGNIIALYIIGMAGEHAFGRLRFLSLFFLTGIVGACSSMIISPGPSVGASGALFGIMGSVAAFIYKRPQVFSHQEKRIGGILIAWMVYAVIQGLLTPYIDNAAHIGGFTAGYCIVFLLVKKEKKEYTT